MGRLLEQTTIYFQTKSLHIMFAWPQYPGKDLDRCHARFITVSFFSENEHSILATTSRQSLSWQDGRKLFPQCMLATTNTEGAISLASLDGFKAPPPPAEHPASSRPLHSASSSIKRSADPGKVTTSQGKSPAWTPGSRAIRRSNVPAVSDPPVASGPAKHISPESIDMLVTQSLPDASNRTPDGRLIAT